jgi:alpha-ketoglutarate-dependent taurine dioxygenase
VRIESEILWTPIEDASVWDARSGGSPEDWTYTLTDADRRELLAALAHVASEPHGELTVERGHPGLGATEQVLARLLDEVIGGRGFAVLRGLPTRELSEADAARLFWLLGLRWGHPVPQNASGQRLVRVFDDQQPSADRRRGYQTREALGFHTDSSDLAALLCLRPALSGGINRVVSSGAVYNEVLRSHPQLMALFYSGFSYDRRGDQDAGGCPVTPRVPIFSYRGGHVSCRYIRGFIDAAADRIGVPLSRLERTALDLFDSITERRDLQLEFELGAGDLVLMNNYTVLHSRTAFEDDERAEHKRLLLRLWLFAPDCRPLASDFLIRDGGSDSRLGRPNNGRPQPTASSFVPPR